MAILFAAVVGSLATDNRKLSAYVRGLTLQQQPALSRTAGTRQPARTLTAFIRIDTDKCKKCSKCARNCPVNAITGVPGKVPYYIDASKCIKCGACLANCHFGAVERK